MRYYPSRAACCAAEKTWETSVQLAPRSGLLKRAKQIHHKDGDMRWWHWSDQDMTHWNALREGKVDEPVLG